MELNGMQRSDWLIGDDLSDQMNRFNSIDYIDSS